MSLAEYRKIERIDKETNEIIGEKEEILKQAEPNRGAKRASGAKRATNCRRSERGVKHEGRNRYTR